MTVENPTQSSAQFIFTPTTARFSSEAYRRKKSRREIYEQADSAQKQAVIARYEETQEKRHFEGVSVPKTYIESTTLDRKESNDKLMRDIDRVKGYVRDKDMMLL